MTAPPILYATPWQAAADANNLRADRGCADILQPLLHHIRNVVADPRASSDHLLIVADALRSEALASAICIPSYATQIHRWANTLTDLAPTRANPIERA